jgi:hypothetical protein
MIGSDTVRALCDFAREQGAQIEFRPTGSGHYKVVITRAGRSRFITLARSPHASNLKAALGDARRALRAIDARGNSREDRMRRWYAAKGEGLLVA